MTDPLRLGLVGAGAIAQSYIKALEGSSLARWVGIADVRPEAAAAAAELMGCDSYRSHEELADRAKCDAVVICTPPSCHAAIALHFIERNIAVLCEKPLSIDVASARALCAAAESNGVVMAMASKFRYVDDVIRARSIIASGLLGEIVLMENAFTATVNMSRRWNADPGTSGGGVLIDNGTHSVDIVRYLLGPISEVFVVEGRRNQELRVEDTVNMFMRTADGVSALVDLSWSINKELDDYIRVFGTNGTIHVGWRESRYRQSSSPDWIVFGSGYDKLSAFRRQLANFCSRVLGIEPLLIGSDDAVASVEVIHAAYDSLAEGRWVAVDSASSGRPAALREVATRPAQ
jgi:predicted dehydrogenase